ncbi:MAG: choice-of-anchor D domain-containing protein [Deltaproteobacteria bacterium]|nr:choice-of-anchor D domain-containing protein [Deltaproteobacteria bacterium]
MRCSPQWLLLLLFLPRCNCGEGAPLYDARSQLMVLSDPLDIGTVAIGSYPKVAPLALKNPGGAAITIKSAALVSEGGELTIDEVPDVIPSGRTLHAYVRYQPADEGEDRAVLRLETDDALGLHEVDVIARGVSIELGVEPATDACGGAPSVGFGSVAVGAEVRQTIRLRANGHSPIQLKSVALETSSNDYALSPMTMPQTIEPGQVVELQVAFHPTASRALAATVVIVTDDPRRAETRLQLCGEGLAAEVCVNPASHDFGVLAAGASGNVQIDIQSCGAVPLQIGSVRLIGEGPTAPDPGFSASGGLEPTALAPGEHVTVAVRFSSTTPGVRRVYLAIDSNAHGTPAFRVPLRARVPGPCSWSVLPGRLDFHSGGQAALRQILMVNDGDAECHVTRVELADGAPTFVLETPGEAPLVIAAGGSRSIGVTYDPRSVGPSQGRVVFETELAQRAEVQLAADPALSGGCHLDPRPRFLALGVVRLGERAAAGAEMVNVGSAACTISRVALGSGSATSLSVPVLAAITLNPGQRTVIPVQAQPQLPGPIRGQLVVTSNDADQPQLQLPVFGLAADARLCAEPQEINFGTTALDAVQQLRIVACGAAPVEVRSVGWKTEDVELALIDPPALPRTLAPGEIIEVGVQYRPADAVDDQAVIGIRSDDPVQAELEVPVTAGRLALPLTAGQYLYYWQIRGSFGEIRRLSLQITPSTTEPVYGPATSNGCGGCHSVSPDGRYVALISEAGLRILEAGTQRDVTPSSGLPPSYGFVSWNPDPDAGAGHELVVGYGSLRKLSVVAGDLGVLPGSETPGHLANMPTWGPNGVIAYVRGASGWEAGFSGPTDVMLIPEAGGTPTPLRGASANARANYYPAFSPNGRWIVLTQSDQAATTVSASDGRLALAAAGNTGVVLPMLAANGGSSSYARWSRDGRYLSFASNRPGGVGGWDLYVAPIDPISGADGRAINLRDINSPDAEHLADWSP